MESLQGRVESFSKTKRFKNPSKPSATIAVKWPHPKSFQANPDTLAEAGFYYNPSYDNRDNATCYLCEKDIGDWEKDDDPFYIHWEKCGWSCGWAASRCALREDMDEHGRFVFHDKARVPTSKAMERARLDTYTAGDGWKHDRSKNHGSNSKKMAQAGFVFTPQHAEDDLATCLYCNLCLSGWEPEDDPMEEHKKRATRTGTTCPFLVFVEGSSAKLPSKQSTKPPSRTTSKMKHQDIVMPTKTHDGDPDGDGASDSAASSASASAKGGKGKKARSSSKVRSSSAKGGRLARSTSKQKEESEDEVEEEAVEEATKTRTGRSTSKKKVVSDDEVDEEDVKEAPKKRGRPPSKSIARSVSSKYPNEEEDVPVPTKKRTARSKSVARSVPPSEDEVDEAPLPSRKRASSRVPSKSTARSAAQAEDEAEEAPKPTRKRAPSRVLSKSIARSIPPSEDEVEEVQPPTTNKRAGSRVPSKSIPRTVAQSEDDVEIPPPTKKRVPSRTGSKSAMRSVPPSEDGGGGVRSRAKSKALESEAEVEENLIPRKPSRSKSKVATSESESEVDVVPRKSSRSTKPRPTVVMEEDEDPQDEPHKKPSTKARSKANATDSEVDEAPSKPAKAAKGKPPSKASSKLKAKAASMPVDEEPEQVYLTAEEEDMDHRSDIEDESVKPSRGKPPSKAVSKSKVQPISAPVDEESEGDEDMDQDYDIEVKPVKAPRGKPPSKVSSKAKAKPVPVDEEPEQGEQGDDMDHDSDVEGVPVKAPRSKPLWKVSSKVKAKPVPVVVDEEPEQAEQDDDMGHDSDVEEVPVKAPKGKPPSKASSKAKGKGKAKLVPDFVDEEPERTEQDDDMDHESDVEEVPVEAARSEALSKTSSKAKAKPVPDFVDDNMDHTTDAEEKTLTPITVLKGRSSSKATSKPNAKLPHIPVDKGPVRTEAIAEDDDLDILSTQQERKPSISASPAAVEPEEEDVFHDVTMHDVQDVQPTSSTSTRAALPSDHDISLVPSPVVESTAVSSAGHASAAPISRESTIMMEQSPVHAPLIQVHAVEDDNNRDIADVTMHEDHDVQPVPSTPPRYKAPIRHDQPVTPIHTSGTDTIPNESQPSTIEEPTEPPIIPPLSKLPFTRLQALTDAELDMTVEEWIRYQMEVEYDKFRRDGERELLRFRKKADEVRKIIEGL